MIIRTYKTDSFVRSTPRQYLSASFGEAVATQYISAAWIDLEHGIWYVRPLGGSYGQADGANYTNAFNGFANIDWDAISAGETLYVCGTHCQTLVAGKGGTGASAQIIISGAYLADPGIIDGLQTINNANFLDHSGDIKKLSMVSDIDYFNSLDSPPATPQDGEKWLKVSSETEWENILDGTMRLGGMVSEWSSSASAWLQYSDGYFWRPGFLIVDGVLVQSCRHPKSSVALFDNLDSYNEAKTVLTDASFNIGADNIWANAELYWLYFHTIHENAKILSSTGSTITIRGDFYGNGEYEPANLYFYIDNSLPTISVANEWAHKDDYLYFHTPSTKVIQYPSISYGVFIAEGSDYVRVTGLSIKNTNDAGVHGYNLDYAEIDNNEIENVYLVDYNYMGRLPGAINLHLGTGHNVHDNNVHDIYGPGANGIVFRDITNGTIDGNTVEDIGMNITDRFESRAIGIYVLYGSGNDVLDNHITMTNYSGIRMHTIDFLVDGNVITDACMFMGDGGGIYTCWTTPLSVNLGGTISNNVIQRVHPNVVSWVSDTGLGIYLDSGSDNIIVEYNTVFGIHYRIGSNPPIFLNNQYYELYGDVYTGTENNVVRYNDIYYDGTNDMVVETGTGTDIYGNTLYEESEYVEV